MLAIFGDSIAAGLGVRGPTYGQQVADTLELGLADFSGTALMVPESVEIAAQTSLEPRISLLAHGITEGIIRPAEELLRHMPRRWRRLGWMDPRPYYSSKLHRRIPQQLESALRWRVRVALISTGKTYRLVPPDVYGEQLGLLAELLAGRGSRVVILGPPALDGRFFPGSPQSLTDYESVSRAIAADRHLFVPLWDVCERWSDYAHDHFHPNDSGHKRIADAVVGAIFQSAQ